MLKQSRSFFCGVLSDNEKQGPSVSATTMAFTLIAWNKARLDISTSLLTTYLIAQC